MRRKYKLLIIIVTSIIIAYFIYFNNRESKINLVALGDGIASGETSYAIDGISYNDYLKEYYSGKKLLKSYNNSYAYENYKLHDVINDLKDNKKLSEDKLSIKQIIHKADIITLAFLEEELIKLAMTNDLNKEIINEYIQDYDNFLYLLKDITEAKIVIVGFYENKYLKKSDVIILNSEIANMAKKYNVLFININDLLKDDNYYLDKESFYFNYKAHQQIADMIINSL